MRDPGKIVYESYLNSVNQATCRLCGHLHASGISISMIDECWAEICDGCAAGLGKALRNRNAPGTEVDRLTDLLRSARQHADDLEATAMQHEADARELTRVMDGVVKELRDAGMLLHRACMESGLDFMDVFTANVNELALRRSIGSAVSDMYRQARELERAADHGGYRDGQG